MAEPEPWWCDCPDRKGPHVHMPNWGAKGGSLMITALVDIETGLEIPGSRSNETPPRRLPADRTLAA